MSEGDDFRPRDFDEFIGQERIKRQLELHIQAAMNTATPLEHVLLTGPPGSGKTTLATLIAKRLKEPVETRTMPLKRQVFHALIESHYGVLFLDEIHRAPKSQQEDLLPVLENGTLETEFGYRIENGWLTVIGATTEPENIIPPLFDRFMIRQPFELYSEQDMESILLGMVERTGANLKSDDIEVLAGASAGTPRTAKRFILTALNLQATNEQVSAHTILDICQVSREGLDPDHSSYLQTLHKVGGQAGLDTLTMMLRLNRSIVLRLERVLLDKDLIRYAPRGRRLTSDGYKLVKEWGSTRKAETG